MAVDERDREEIFQDYIDDIFKNQLEAQADKSEQAVKKLKELFESRLEKQKVKEDSESSSEYSYKFDENPK